MTGLLTSRRNLLVGTAIGGLTLTACGDDAPTAEAPPGARRIEGALGDIDVVPDPQRIVSVGQYRDTDAAVALDVVPVMSPDLSDFVEGGVTPWVRTALAGRELPLYDAEILPYERIFEADADLILATDRSALEGAEYDRLSSIAPTLSWRDGYNRDEWRTTTARVGEALDKVAEAAAVVARVEGAITAARSANPQLTGTTFTFGPVQSDGTVNTINSIDDGSVKFFNELGLVLSPTVRDLEDAAFPGRAVISTENLELLEADVVILTYNTDAAREEMEASSIFRAIPAVREGRYVALDLPSALALGFPSALSIEYAVQEVLPRILEVVA